MSGFFIAALILVAIRLILMAFFPVAGDEAYYFYWGRHPAGGYYDLSPMIGWWEVLFTRFFSSSFWLRIPNLFAVGAVTFGMAEWLERVVGSDRARMNAMLFFFSPIPFLAVLVSPDVPLLFFSFFAVLLFYQQRPWSVFFSGALWGAAFLSKYFALFLLPPMLLWLLFQSRKSWRSRVGLALAFALGAAPFGFQHLYWNAHHCWANVVFNLVTRQQAHDGPLPGILVAYVAYLLILATPFFWTGLRFRDSVDLRWGLDRVSELHRFRRYLFGMWFVPILLFGITALMGKGQGLHWYLSYVPFFFAWAGLGLSSSELRSRLKGMLVLTGVLALVALSVSLQPRSLLTAYFSKHFTYDFNAVTLGQEQIERLMPKLSQVDAVFTDGYTQASVLDFSLRRTEAKMKGVLPPVNVWGEGSRFGRTFDWTVNWPALEGKRVLLVTRGLPDANRWKKYFSEWTSEVEELGSGKLKSSYFVTLGTGFQASLYRNEIVKPAIRHFYPVEKLPFPAASCILENPE